MNLLRIVLLMFLLSSLSACRETNIKQAVVFQSDFGTSDGAVSAMKGVAYEVDSDLALFDLTHEIESYNIWEGAYRLFQTASYWPKGTVFVSVVDPGVGTERKSIVMKTRSGHYFVTPDNGSLTLVAEQLGVAGVREIDEAINRRTNSQGSYTFHGRDVYAFTAARLAAGQISFEEVGRDLDGKYVSMPYQRARISGDSVYGNIPVLDVQYGNVWTNIPDTLIRRWGMAVGDTLSVTIEMNNGVTYIENLTLANTFGDVEEGEVLAYYNSLMNFSVAINQGNFADSFRVKAGPGATIILTRKKRR